MHCARRDIPRNISIKRACLVYGVNFHFSPIKKNDLTQLHLVRTTLSSVEWASTPLKVRISPYLPLDSTGFAVSNESQPVPAPIWKVQPKVSVSYTTIAAALRPTMLAPSHKLPAKLVMMASLFPLKPWSQW